MVGPTGRHRQVSEMATDDNGARTNGAGHPAPPEPFVGGMGGMELVWRCGRCGHLLYDVESPPDRCGVCGARREEFVRQTED